MKEVKRSSSLWINENKLTNTKFAWQEGYGAFSYSKSQVDNVIKYINNQENHHRKQSLKDEYVEILKNLEIEYDERYIFQDLI